jgi:prophage regulatory protein
MARTVELRNLIQPRDLDNSPIRGSEDLQIPTRRSGAEVGGAPTRMLRLSQVIERTGLGKTKIYELQNAGLFPMKVHLTPTAVRWIEGEIEAWLAAHARARFRRSEL